MAIFDKNRKRGKFEFANINLLGKCNVDCYFCLGKDLEEELAQYNQLRVHFSKWKNFVQFLDLCKDQKIHKLYITGQNTDSLLYKYLGELISYLHVTGFKVGLRTNGFLALQKMDAINQCELSTGYSIHTLNPVVQKMMLGTSVIPNWKEIIKQTQHPRVQIVITRCNVHEFFPLINFLSKFPNIKYVQARKVSTDTRQELLEPDAIVYEKLYTQISKSFPLIRKLWGDAEEYDIFGTKVCFWRTAKTDINSINYFTNGVISEEYFVIEGYLNNKKYYV